MTQAYNLSQLANNLNTNGQLDATDGLINIVPVLNGGTGVNNAAALTLLIGNVVFPIGSIYTAIVSTNPSTLLGFGTWVAFGAGRVPVGFNASNPLFDSAEETGGSADAVVVSHTHTATVSDPGHAHTYSSSNIAGVTVNSASPTGGGIENTSTATTGISVTNTSTGVSGTNGNYQPYITVFMWKRTA